MSSVRQVVIVPCDIAPHREATTFRWRVDGVDVVFDADYLREFAVDLVARETRSAMLARKLCRSGQYEPAAHALGLTTEQIEQVAARRAR